MKSYEESLKVLFETLGPQERVFLRKENPLLKKRNELIFSLKNEGASYEILKRASGLSLTQLYVIVKKFRGSKN
jgi:Mor family transcriptional regulator